MKTDIPIGSPASIEMGEGRCGYITASALVHQSWIERVIWLVRYNWWMITTHLFERWMK